MKCPRMIVKEAIALNTDNRGMQKEYNKKLKGTAIVGTGIGAGVGMGASIFGKLKRSLPFKESLILPAVGGLLGMVTSNIVNKIKAPGRLRAIGKEHGYGGMDRQYNAFTRNKITFHNSPKSKRRIGL